MPTPKPKPEAPKGIRLNQAITARTVRLVMDEGHRVVSIQEALDCAMKLKLDLVEVDRKSNPPVCKIMDFHKEKYIQEMKEKERKKIKTKIRSGDNKEVRFKSKTESKDLKFKADAIIRLMERGYRVKCMAIPAGKQKGKQEGKQDGKQHGKQEEGRQESKHEAELRSTLSRLLALIEDVAIVESGPHVVEKQAYVIVRHIKFRPKKFSKKSVKSLDAAREGVHSAVTNSEINSTTQDEISLEAEEEWELECSSETENEDTSQENEHNIGPTTFPKEDVNKIMGRSEPADVDRSKPLHHKVSPKPVFDSPKTRLDLNKEQTDVNYSNRFVATPMEPPVVENNRYSKQRETKDRYPPIRPTGRVPHQAIGNDSGRQGQFDPKHRQINPGDPGSRRPGYGIFCARQPADRQATGAFTAQKTAPSGEQNHSGDATVGNAKNPGPSYGIFSSSNPVPSDGQKKP